MSARRTHDTGRSDRRVFLRTRPALEGLAGAVGKREGCSGFLRQIAARTYTCAYFSVEIGGVEMKTFDQAGREIFLCWRCNKRLIYYNEILIFRRVNLPNGTTVKTHKVCAQDFKENPCSYDSNSRSAVRLSDDPN